MTTETRGDTELRLQLYSERRSELLQRQFSNCEAYDQAVLTLSSGLLGLSLAFIADVVPVARAVGLGWLYASWVALACAIVTTLASFWVSNRGAQHELERAERYYLRRDDSALGRSRLSTCIEYVNGLAGALFATGVVLTIVFVWINLSEVGAMTNRENGNSDSVAFGQGIPKMQEVVTVHVELMTKGQLLAPMQPMPAQSQGSTTSQAASQPTAPPPSTAPKT